jgi:AcrR family transcriptional regulator
MVGLLARGASLRGANVYDVNIMKRNVDDVNMTARRPQKAAAKNAYHHGNLRSALIEAGLALLEGDERGELSLRAIARGAGVSANAAYRHFADKEALLVALAAEGFRRLQAAHLAAAEAAADPRQGMRAAGHAYIDFARSNPALFRLMFGRFTTTHRDQELAQAALASFETLRNGVAAASQGGAEDPRVVVAAVYAWGLVHGLSHLLLDGQLSDLAEDPDTLIDATLKIASKASAALSE